MRDRPSWWLLAALTLIAAACGYLLFGCGPINPCAAERIACLANGGTWVAEAPCGRCEYPPEPEDPCAACSSGQTCVDGKCIDPPPPPECLRGIPWCGVNQVCSTPESPCKHNPTTDPNHCELAPICPLPPPPPPSDETCAAPGAVPSGYLESQLVPMGDPTPKYHDAIFAATRKLGDRRHCMFRENLDALAAQLALDVPGVPIISGKEATFIERTPGGLWDEYHSVSAADNSWTNSGRGKYIGVHKYAALACGGEFARWNQGCPASLPPWFHCTPLVGPDAAYCAALGYTDGRLFCPPRLDGDPKREACEVQVMRGDPDWRSDGRVILKNRLMAKCTECSYLEICLPDETHCARKEF